MTESPGAVCVVHCRFEEKHEHQEKFEAEQKQTNEILHSKLNRIDGKLNWILGGVAVGWPLILIIFHLVTKGKP